MILAGRIRVALLTTAVGLAVAMPASVLAAWYDGRLENERVAVDALIDPPPDAERSAADARRRREREAMAASPRKRRRRVSGRTGRARRSHLDDDE